MNRVNFSPFDFSTYQNHQYNALVDETIYDSDEFRMYAYKIKKCPRTTSHNWKECPYAHKGETAKRRDPLKYKYEAIVCPQFRNGNCHKGDLCEYAHGVFEYWLHPDKYRTRLCKAGLLCDRKFCFFAHTPKQLRVEPKLLNHHHRCCHHDDAPLVMRVGNDVAAGSSSSAPVAMAFPDEAACVAIKKREDEESYGRIAELAKIWKALKIRGVDGFRQRDESSYGFDTSELSLPEIDWIKELVH